MPLCLNCGAAFGADAPNCPACGAPAPPAEPDLHAAFVGDNYAYYKRRWEAMARDGRRFSFNWPAFWLGFVWLAYRKMYLYAFLYVLFLVVESGVEIYLNVPERAGLAITLAIGLATGGYANYVYRLHADRIVARVQAARFQDVAAEAARRGGTSLLAAGASILLALIGVLALLYVADPALFAAAPSSDGAAGPR